MHLLRAGTIAFAAGILALLLFPALPPVYCHVALFCILYSIGRWVPSAVGFLLLCFLVGLVYAQIRAELILSRSIDPSIEGQTVYIVGQIASLPSARHYGLRFEFDVNQLIDSNGNDYPSPGKVRLNWYSPPQKPAASERWRLAVRLKRPYGFRNPGGFDYEGWLFQEGIRATGYVVSSHELNQRLEKAPFLAIDRIRETARDRISALLAGKDYMPLVVALGIGERSQIRPGHHDILVSTGTNHLLAISGLHIGLVSVFSYFVFVRLFRFSGSLLNHISAQHGAIGLAIMAAMAYAFLAGFSTPTQRALIMTMVVWLLLLGGRVASPSTIICIALIVVLVFDPFTLLSAGFWLSFTAVSIILFGMTCRPDRKRWWWRWGRAQFLVTIGLMPLLIFCFQQYAVGSFLANVIAIPWVSLAVVPFLILGIFMMPVFPAASSMLLIVTEFNLSLIMWLLEWLTAHHLTLLDFLSPSVIAFLFAIVGVFLLLMPAGMPVRRTGLLWILPLFLGDKAVPDTGEVWFALLDVGQGMAAVVETRDHVLVYDTGAKFSETFNAGEAVVIPYLKHRKRTFLDRIIISHGDNDHMGGSSALIAQYDYGEILSSVPQGFKSARSDHCFHGQQWSWDQVEFEILHPLPGHSYRRSNNQSCVLMISTSRHKFLLTGDIEKKVERELVSQYGEDLSVDIITVPHHGSKSSSSPEFLNATQPGIALLPVGYRNRFRLPNQQVIERYQDRNIKLFDTAKDGSILIKSGASGLSIKTYRHYARRFWHTLM